MTDRPTEPRKQADDVVPHGSAVTLGSTYGHDFHNYQSDDLIPRFALQSAARELAPQRRVKNCLRAVVPNKTNVEIWKSAKTAKAYFYNLMTCGEIWVCPICASKITERRRQVLEKVLNATDRVGFEDHDGNDRVVLARRWYLTMVTFTIKHNASEPAQAVIGRIRNAYKSMWRGRASEAFRVGYRVIGTLRAFELTHGKHGWHPHYHLLLVRSRPNTEVELHDMDIELTVRWLNACESVGGIASLERGVKVSGGDDRVIEYIQKMGQQVGSAMTRWTLAAEISKYPAKRGREDNRTMWDLLADYMTYDVNAGELWIEGIEALKGVHHLCASKGLWHTLGLDNNMDDEISLSIEAKSSMDELLASLDLNAWRLIVKYNLRGTILTLAQDGGDVLQFCEDLKKRESMQLRGALKK